MSRLRFCIVALASAVLFAGSLGCSSDPAVDKDANVSDLPASKDGSTELAVSDGAPDGDGAAGDGLVGDGRGEGPIEIRPDGSRASVNATSGGTISSGGVYTLHSTLGPGLNIDPTSGGAFVLRFNGSVIPW
ncbi:MAG: hypothetical protein KC503_44385 [Myxococcales bacterium]|nr:hypothetical protein [Myxococcales bacterium]